MTTILLIGIPDADAGRLAAAIAVSGDGLTHVRVSDVRVPDDVDAGDTVAVLSAVGSLDLESSVAQAVDLALPVLVLMPGLSAAGVDVTRGHVDFCFPPFRPAEFALRVGLLADRSGGRERANVVQQGEIRIDLERYEVTVSGRKVDLTFKEYELLRVLASNPGHVYSRDALLQTVWEYDYYGGTRTVDVHIRRLRSKINDVEHRFIETVWNVGYRFKAPEV